jgi:trigger factor
VPDDAVEAQIDALRERFADLEDKPGALADGDYAQIDIKGSAPGPSGAAEAIDALSATDFLYEVGSSGLVPELDAQLRGAKPGDILEFRDALPERFGERAGDDVSFRVLVKQAKRKILPEADDEWASEASEFDTIDELRADARARLELYALVQTQMLVRDKVLEAVSELVDVEAPEPLVAQEMERRLHDLHHRLEPQGVNITQFLAATGQDQEEFVANVREGAARAVKADLALRAVVAQEGITASDDELDAEIERLADRLGESAAKVRRDLEQRGALEAVRSEIARGKALEHMVERASVVDEHGASVDLTLPEARAEAQEPAAQAEEPEE